MQRTITVLEILIPIFIAIALGMLARRRNSISREGVTGMQQYVLQFGLPCVLFNSCLSANLGAQALTSMALVLPMMLISVLWAFRARRKQFPYHNLPQLFAAQESGMLGIPLYMTLFGSAQAYRMGVLDMAQSLVCISTIALLTASAGQSAKVSSIIKQILSSPLLILSLLGLALNLTGCKAWLESIGVLSLFTETAGFIAQPVSAAILFSVGYNFSLGSGNRSHIFRIAVIHFLYFALFGLLIQLVLFLLPGVEAETRWAILIYTTLPASFLSLGLGRNEEEYEMAAGVCSLLTAVSLAIFCVVAVIVS